MTSAGPIDFWFDFISPYGYLASLRINEIASRHGRQVRWHPILLGVSVLKVMGLKPLMETPLKKDYVPREVDRYLRLYGLTLARDLKSPPMNPLPAARAFAWMLRHDTLNAQKFAQQVYERYWAKGEDMSQLDGLAQAASSIGVEPSFLQAAIGPEGAFLLREEVDDALRLGVFGSPFFILDDEPFFGVDKLELISTWLERGGW